MSLTHEQLLMLDSLVYYEQFSDKYTYDDASNSYKTVGEFIKAVDKYKTCFNNIRGYTDEDLGMDKIISFIEEDDVLKSLVIVYPTHKGDPTTSSVCLVDPEEKEVYVIFGANYAEGEYEYTTHSKHGDIEAGTTFLTTSWKSNTGGAVKSDTGEQLREVEFYEDAVDAARDYLSRTADVSYGKTGDEEKELKITVSGHSAGGNHAEYVTVAYKQSSRYNKNNDIGECVSFDSQGFSESFFEKYNIEIKDRASKITSYSPTVSIVDPLLQDIQGINKIFIDIGIPDAFLIGYHMMAEFLDEEGHFKSKGIPGVEYSLLYFTADSAVRIAKSCPFIDEDNAMEKLGGILDFVMENQKHTKEEIWEVVKESINNKDLKIMSQILTQEAGLLLCAAYLMPEAFVASKLFIDTVNDMGVMYQMIRNGQINEAFERGSQYIAKFAVGIKMFGLGMETGHPLVALTGFFVGCSFGETVTKLVEENFDVISDIIDNAVCSMGDSIMDFFSSLYDIFEDTFLAKKYTADPLVLDLGGDGFEITSIMDGVYFDDNNEGLAEKTQWVSPDDGLLAIDLNGDGIINDGSELFGTSTAMADGSLAKSGFEALMQYDTNGDGVIDENDDVYSRLLIWQDFNSDGISQPDELKSLAEMGIKSISLSAGMVDGINTADITYEDGNISHIGEFYFDAELYNTREKDMPEISDDNREKEQLWVMQ